MKKWIQNHKTLLLVPVVILVVGEAISVFSLPAVNRELDKKYTPVFPPRGTPQASLNPDDYYIVSKKVLPFPFINYYDIKNYDDCSLDGRFRGVAFSSLWVMELQKVDYMKLCY